MKMEEREVEEEEGRGEERRGEERRGEERRGRKREEERRERVIEKEERGQGDCLTDLVEERIRQAEATMGSRQAVKGIEECQRKSRSRRRRLC
jgi:hypothetical protein